MVVENFDRAGLREAAAQVFDESGFAVAALGGATGPGKFNGNGLADGRHPPQWVAAGSLIREWSVVYVLDFVGHLDLLWSGLLRCRAWKCWRRCALLKRCSRLARLGRGWFR